MQRFTGLISQRKYRSTEPIPRMWFRLPGYLCIALWCMVSHVVSGLATYLPYMNESGINDSTPLGV